MKYGLDSRPGFFPMLMYGLQWWAVSLPCVVIMGLVVARMHYPDAADQVFYMQKLFGTTGVVLVAQIFWGHRLPLVVGPASVLLIGVASVRSAGVSAVYTSVLLCGALVALLAYGGALSRVQRIFTPRIVTVILCLIAFTLSPVILRMVFGGEAVFNLFFALALVLVLVLANRWLPGVWKSLVVLLGLAGGTLLYGLWQEIPVPGVVAGAPQDGFFIRPAFDPGVFLSFLFCYVALLINELGSVQAVGGLLKADGMARRTGRGVGMTGLGNLLSGWLGVVGPVDYSMSPGVIAATGCASRYPLAVAGAGLLACAFFPRLILWLGAVPEAVMGAVLLYLMASQLSAGLQMLVREKSIADFRDGLVVGLPLMAALLLSFAPEEALAGMPSLLRPLFGNGFVVGVLLVLLLEHLVLRREKK